MLGDRITNLENGKRTHLERSEPGTYEIARIPIFLHKIQIYWTFSHAQTFLLCEKRTAATPFQGTMILNNARPNFFRFILSLFHVQTHQ